MWNKIIFFSLLVGLVIGIGYLFLHPPKPVIEPIEYVTVYFTDGTNKKYIASYIEDDSECTSGLFAGGGCKQAQNYILHDNRYTVISRIPINKVEHVDKD